MSINKKDVYKIPRTNSINVCIYLQALGAISSSGQEAQTVKKALPPCRVEALKRRQCAHEVGRNDATDISSPTNF